MFDIAIIGLAATGISLLSELNNAVYSFNLPKLNIIIFNPDKSFAKGLAFGDSDDIHKVNTPPEMLALNSYEPNKFINDVIRNNERHPIHQE